MKSVLVVFVTFLLFFNDFELLLRSQYEMSGLF